MVTMSLTKSTSLSAAFKLGFDNSNDISESATLYMSWHTANGNSNVKLF